MIKRFIKHLSQSLSGRLILASTLLLPFILAITTTALDRAFARSQEVAEQERLRTQIYLLLAAAEIFDGILWLPEQLQEPRFSQPDSGLYARVIEADKIIWQSLSAVTVDLPAPINLPIQVGQEVFYDSKLNKKDAHNLIFDVSWEQSPTQEKLYRFEIISDQDALIAERNSYRKQLWRWLGALALILVIVLWWIQNWGLKPLSHLAEDLKRVETGETLSLGGTYPTEIQPVITNLNKVLEIERAQRDRYRNTMADLAHSLKTPLAVIRSSSDRPDIVDEQVSRMDEIVRHQLQRAVTQQSSQPGKGHSVLECCQRLVSALSKVYRDKNPSFDLEINANQLFFGEQADLLELLGNLLDNACKYGRGKVRIKASTRHKILSILVEDNGLGVKASDRRTILERGARADTAETGQGIGLAVAVDIVSSYNGSLSVADSSLGGAAFNVELPIG